MEQYLPFIWVGLAILTAVLEAITLQLVSIWFMFGALSAAITSVFTTSVSIQLTVFLVVSIAALFGTKPIIRKIRKNNPKVNTNADRLIGKIGIVVFDDNQSFPRVKVENEIWTTKSQNTQLIKGQKARVLSIEGVRLLVEPIN